MHNNPKQGPDIVAVREQEEKPAGNEKQPEIMHIGSGGAFSESEGDIEGEQDTSATKTETPY